MKKTIIFLLLFPFLLAACDCSDTNPNGTAPPVVLQWTDGETGEVLFTTEDLEAYDKDRQLFRLKAAPAEKFRNWAKNSLENTLTFAVKDDKSVIFEGRFFNPASKERPDKNTILIVAVPQDNTVFKIQTTGGSENNSLSSDRLLAPMKKSGLLSEIKVPGYIDPADKKNFIAGLQWVDINTGKLLFTIRDIKSFDWNAQIFILNPQAAASLIAVIGKSAIMPYSLRDEEGIIYKGAFLKLASSHRPMGVNIYAIEESSETYLKIHSTCRPGEDLSRSERLRAALEKAGVLTDLELPPSLAEIFAPLDKSTGLQCVDMISGAVLFTAEDLEGFDWEKRLFKLKPAAAERFEKWAADPDGKHNFAIRLNEKDMIIGHVMSQEADYIPHCAVIRWDEYKTGKTEFPHFYSLRNCNLDSDTELAKRLRAALLRAGVLGKFVGSKSPDSPPQFVPDKGDPN